MAAGAGKTHLPVSVAIRVPSPTTVIECAREIDRRVSNDAIMREYPDICTPSGRSPHPYRAACEGGYQRDA